MIMIRRFLALSTLPLLMGSAIALVGADRAIAHPSSPLAQASSQPQRGQGRQRPRIDFAAAAARLNTTEAELKEALGLPAQRPGNTGNWRENRRRPDLQTAAAQLGVSEAQLRQALQTMRTAQPRQPGERRSRPSLQPVATQLGVTEAALRQALSLPEPGAGWNRPMGNRRRLDIQGAATRLGVTEQQVIDALNLQAFQWGDRHNNGQ